MTQWSLIPQSNLEFPVILQQVRLAERVGFEPTYTLLGRNSISSRARCDLFGTSPGQKATKVDKFTQYYFAARRTLAGRRFV
jgi:hypothetical protein